MLINGKEKAQAVCESSDHFVISAELKALSGLADVKLVFNADHDKEILELENLWFSRKIYCGVS